MKNRLLRRSPRLRRWIRRRKIALDYWLARFALLLPRPFSLARALALSDRIGDLVYLVLPRTRALALEHIGIALGDTLPAKAREHIVRAAFRNIARSFCEVAKFDEILPQLDRYVEVEGWEHVERILAEGKGAIAVTGHIGNWELLAATCARRGLTVAAIARRMRNPRLNQLLVDFRARSGVQTILRESPGASRQILAVLKAKGILALLIDQDTRAPSLSVPFFGRMARTPAAAAALAVRRNLPAIPCFMQRRPQGGHLLTILAPIPPPRSGDRHADVVSLTRVFNETIEDRIRRNPAEWVWWHRRWRRAPIARLDLDQEIPYSSSNSVMP
jgi:Kdo2-lipid IVA lauroyltransferase/acyltransferase